MAIAIVEEKSDATTIEPRVGVPPQAVVALMAGMIAAWLAAGSTGLLGHGLQHVLTWIALSVAVVAVWPKEDRSFKTWAILALGGLIAVVLTASTTPAINVFGVAIMLAAIAQVHRGLTARVVLIASLAAGALGVFRFASDSIPTVWLAADGLVWLLGRSVGWIVGSRLEVGATFGGIDFLVLMCVFYVAWLIATTPPRRDRAVWAATAILLGHFVYLAALAYSEKLTSLLPDVVIRPETDVDHVGAWGWGNGLRSLVPWNLPLLLLVFDCVIGVAMVRWSAWLPVIELDPKELKKQQEKAAKEDVPGSVLAADMVFQFGPVLLGVAAALLLGFAQNRSDLQGKTVLVFDKGYLNWIVPEYDSEVGGYYGLLPRFVESLGGKFVRSKELSKEELDSADVLILLHPDQPWSDELLDRVWNYVREGGSLLLAADPVIFEGKSRSSFNEVLQPTAMRVRYDTAVTRTGNWEQSYDILSHPATAGLDDLRNRFGFELGSSIRTRWPARPVLVGRWGWSDPGSDALASGVSYYNGGELLGDLVLAAEQRFGKGRIFVLGGAAPLQNDMLPNAYPFAGRLLGYLASRIPSPQDPWRQLLGAASLAAMVLLIALRPAAWQIILTSTVLAFSIAVCTAASYWSGCVLPDGRDRPNHEFNNVAYVDASHLEAFSTDHWTSFGVAGLLRTLMRHGFLPLLAPDLSKERLERAGLLISIAPAREFTSRERTAVRNFVNDGGTFICMVGAEQSRTSADLLADYQLAVPPSPVGPKGDSIEPEPLGAFRQVFGPEGTNRYVQFYAGWPVECGAAEAQKWIVWSDGVNELPVVAVQNSQGGTVVVIGDTYFAANANLEMLDHSIPDNIRFWRWLLTRVVPGQKPWDPPPAAKDKPSSQDESADAEAEGEEGE